MHAAASLFFFSVVVFGFAAAALRVRRSAIRLDARCFEALVGALRPVDLTGIQSVASDYLEPRRGQVALEPEVIWHLLGGEPGLKAMQANAGLLLAIAAHATQWNEEEGIVVAERMRRDALRLRTAVRQVRMGMFAQVITGRHWISVPFHLQEAAGAYYLMRRRLLALYENTHVGLLPRLAEAA